MGKFEVLSYLTTKRLTGDDRFFRYQEIHQALRQDGESRSYTSVWRSINGLYSDQLLEVTFEVDGLQRMARFRARLAAEQQPSPLNRIHNTHQGQEQNSDCDTTVGNDRSGQREFSKVRGRARHG